MRDFNRVIRCLAYTLELLVLFMLQETPGLLPPIYGVRPVLLLPAVIAIALFEEEIPAMAFGIVGLRPGRGFGLSWGGAGGAVLFHQPAEQERDAGEPCHCPAYGSVVYRAYGLCPMVLFVLFYLLHAGVCFYPSLPA